MAGIRDKFSMWFMGAKMGVSTSSNFMNRTAGGSESDNKNANNSIFPYSPYRTKQDISTWRSALATAEQGVLPMRGSLQLVYEDTILNDHVRACMTRRKQLTMLRQFVIRNKRTEAVNEKATELFRKAWFSQIVLGYILDARAFGYNLIALGDVKNGEFVNPTVVKRTHVSPDRHIVGMYQDAPTGVNFLESPYKKWHLWVTTPTENGFSTCGMGYLLQVARVEIYLRNTWSWNVSYVETFGNPIRELKTSKTDPIERKQAQDDLEKMGSCSYMLTDPTDEFVLHNSGNNGNGYKSYNDLAFRSEAAISKQILGHADAIDSVPGKTGSAELINTGSRTNDGDAMTPVAKAMRDIQTDDGTFVEEIVNSQLIPMMREIGFSFGVNDEFIFLNDAEEREIKALEADKNQKLATLALTLAQAALRPSIEWLSEEMEMPLEEIQAPITDNNAIKEPKKQNGEPLKNPNMQREQTPPKTELGSE